LQPAHRDGATLVRSLTDILEELGASASSDGTSANPAWSGLDPGARAVLTALIDGQLLGPGRQPDAAAAVAGAAGPSAGKSVRRGT
jgi:predicted Rossmann fold nucleotide-binding protein DprA/Smf involved in DNA uptake